MSHLDARLWAMQALNAMPGKPGEDKPGDKPQPIPQPPLQPQPPHPAPQPQTWT